MNTHQHTASRVRMLLLFFGAILCTAPVARAQQNALPDPSNPAVHAGFGRMLVFDAIDKLFDRAGKPYRFASGTLRKQIAPEQIVSFECDTLQEGLAEIFKEIDPPLTFHIVKGVYILEADPKPRLPGSKVKADGPIQISFGGGPFDEAVETLFSGQKARYRIDPDVTAWQEPVQFKANGTTIDVALTRLLTCVDGLKFRVEEGVYVITPKTQANKPDATLSTTDSKTPPKPTTIYLRDLGPTLKEVSFANTPITDALLWLMGQNESSYVFALPTNDAPVTLHQQNVPLDLALLRVLRATPLLSGIRLNNVDHFSYSPALYLRKSEDIYSIAPGWMQPLPPDVQQSYSFRLANVSLYDALRLLLRGTRVNYELDARLREIKISATARGLSLEQALSKLVAASPAPMKYSLIKNKLILIPK